MAFGIKEIKNETPLWAKRFFRIWMLTAAAVSLWINGTNLVPPAIKSEIITFLSASTPFVWGMSKLFGIKPEEEK